MYLKRKIGDLMSLNFVLADDNKEALVTIHHYFDKAIKENSVDLNIVNIFGVVQKSPNYACPT